MMKLLRSIILGVAATAAAPFFIASHKLPAQEKQPFVTDEPWTHDPVVAYEDGTYYLYCTGTGIGQMTSKDLKQWTVMPRGVLATEDIPAWTHDSVPGFKDHIWAPDVIKYRGKWYLAYSCSTFGKNTSAIGLLSNDRLSNADGWKDEGCIVASQGGRDNWNAIDPNFIVDEEGNPWMTWGSFWDGMQLVRLDSTMHVKAGEKPQVIARRYDPTNKEMPANPTSKYAGRNSIEAPFIMKHGDWYYLFVSWDYCCQGMKSNYRVAVGRSKTVAGPYLDKEGKDMRLGGGTLILEGDKKEFEAMGHCSAYTFPKTAPVSGDYFFCHGYSVKKNGTPILVTKKIKWTADGWPRLKY